MHSGSDSSTTKKPEEPKQLTEKEREQEELRKKEMEANKRFASIDAGSKFVIKRVDGGSMEEEIEEDARLDGEGLQYDVKPGWLNFQFKDEKGKVEDKIYKLFLDEKGHITSPDQSIQGQRAKMETYKLAGQFKLVLSFPNIKSPGDYSLSRVEAIIDQALAAKPIAIRIGDALLIERLSNPRFYEKNTCARILAKIAQSQQNLLGDKDLNAKIEAIHHAHHSDKLQTRTEEVKAAAAELVGGKLSLDKLPQQIKALEKAVDATKDQLSEIQKLLAKGSPTSEIAKKYLAELVKLEKEIKDLRATLNDPANVGKPGVADALKKLQELEAKVLAVKNTAAIEAVIDPKVRLNEKIDELKVSQSELGKAKDAVLAAADPAAKEAAVTQFVEKVKEVRNKVDAIVSDCKKADYKEEPLTGSAVKEAAEKTAAAIDAVKGDAASVSTTAYKDNETVLKESGVSIQYSNKEVEILNNPAEAATKRLTEIAAITGDNDAVKEAILQEHRLLHAGFDRTKNIVDAMPNGSDEIKEFEVNKVKPLLEQAQKLVQFTTTKGLDKDADIAKTLGKSEEKYSALDEAVKSKQEAHKRHTM